MMTYEISQTIHEELWLLLCSFMLGISLMIFYDMIRLFRTLIPQGAIVVAIEDLFFWAVASVSIFLLLFLLNEGRVRFYALAMVGTGMLLYYRLIGKRWPQRIRKRLGKKTKKANIL